MAASEFTVGEEMAFAEARAREGAAELHFHAAAQPFFPLGFSVFRRGPGHWDVTARRCPGKASAWRAANPGGETIDSDDAVERAFAIRGEPGAVTVGDERWDPTRPFPREPVRFRSVLAAMLWVCEELMAEPAAP